jgi:hypothetical protein
MVGWMQEPGPLERNIVQKVKSAFFPNKQTEKVPRMIHPLITMIAKISQEPTQTTTIQWKKEGERENNN